MKMQVAIQLSLCFFNLEVTWTILMKLYKFALACACWCLLTILSRPDTVRIVGVPPTTLTWTGPSQILIRL